MYDYKLQITFAMPCAITNYKFYLQNLLKLHITDYFKQTLFKKFHE